MRKPFYLYILTILIALGSCTGNRQPSRQVVVIHSLGEEGEEGQPFRDYMEACFKKEDLNVEIHHLYLDIVHVPLANIEDGYQEAFADSMEKWNPEVILLNQDIALEWFLRTGDPSLHNGHSKRLSSIFTQTPTVVAGITLMDTTLLKSYTHLTGFEDRPDLTRNLEWAQRVSGGDTVHIELDHTDFDEKMRAYIESHTEDSLLQKVVCLSARTPERNRGTHSADSLGGIKQAEWFLNHCRESHKPQLQVKYDIFSNTFIYHSGIPQFTAIRSQFNAKRRNMLGGYFSSMETQIEDQVGYAARILNGAEAKSLPWSEHEKKYYMDYLAMEFYKPKPLLYSDWQAQCEILNAPLKAKWPFLYYASFGLLGLLILIPVTVIFSFFYHRYLKNDKRSLQKQEAENDLHMKTLENLETYLWYLNQDNIIISKSVKEKYALERKLNKTNFQKYVMSDCQSALERLYDFASYPGKNKIRLHLSWTGKPEDMHWYELIYTVETENIQHNRIMGIAVRIDHIKEVEVMLTHMQEQIDETEQKQNFLSHISHDLRTPLNAVTGFAQLLASSDTSLTAEERKEYINAIRENSEMMKNIIASVINKTENYEHEMNLTPQRVSTSFFVKQVYQTHHILVPSHLELNMENEPKDRYIYIDPGKTRLVLNNFLSNAFKFTPTGNITVGWKYLPDTQEVMVFCRDTGIGLNSEEKKKVFDKFFKAQEKAIGTGLGLNISRMIVEKQNGTIGVDSKPGKGSTFWFKFKEYTQLLVILLTMLFVATGCKLGGWQRKKANVMMVVSHNQEHHQYGAFLTEIKETLKDGGYTPDLRVLYLDAETDKKSRETIVQDFEHSLEEEGWKPDVMLFEGDRPSRMLMEDIPTSYLDFKNTPMVLGALYNPAYWEEKKEKPHMVLWSDPMDFCTNIDLSVQLTGVNLVEIELDHTENNQRLRKDLSEQIKRPPYVNDMDFHEGRLGEVDRQTIFKDSILVLVLDTQKPWLNVHDMADAPTGRGTRALQSIYSYAWQYPQLVVKDDPYADMIASKTNRPQFTAVKEHFGNGNTNYLAGYFASYNTIAHDMAETAILLLNGTPPESIKMKEHKKEFWMDYNAMKRLGMDYADYKRKYNIINAPYHEAHQMRFLGWVIAGILFFILTTYLITRIMLNLDNAKIKKRTLRVEEANYINSMAMKGAECLLLHNEAEVRKYLRRASSGQEELVEQIQENLKIQGKYIHDLKGDMLKRDKDEYWELRLLVREGKPVNGLLLNINERERQRMQLKHAEAYSMMAKEKENFMEKTSLEISNPLNAIYSYCEELTAADVPEERKKELSEKIGKNSNLLTGIINDLLQFSRIESGRQQYYIEEILISGLIRKIYDEWKETAREKGLKIQIIEGRPDVVAQVDAERLHDILNQLMSNAVKFSEKGFVVLGWRYRLGKKTVEIFVEDSGIGISEQKQDEVFSLFWKENNFVPGVGLGLNIAKRLTDNMDGKLLVDSQEGLGSRFSIHLPAHTA